VTRLESLKQMIVDHKKELAELKASSKKNKHGRGGRLMWRIKTELKIYKEEVELLEKQLKESTSVPTPVPPPLSLPPPPPPIEKYIQMMELLGSENHPPYLKQLLKEYNLEGNPVESYETNSTNGLRVKFKNTSPGEWFKMQVFIEKFHAAFFKHSMKEILSAELAAGRVPIDLSVVLKDFDIHSAYSVELLFVVMEELGDEDPNKRHYEINMSNFKDSTGRDLVRVETLTVT